MASTLAIEAVLQRVSARFETEGPQCTQLFGWHAVYEQVEGDRIVWAPGDPKGKVGATLPPKRPGRNPRPIATLGELFTVTISAADVSAPDDEAAQYRAAWLLRMYWFRAVYLASHGKPGFEFQIVDEQWLVDRKERRYGATLQITLLVEAAIYDLPPSAAGAVEVQVERVEVDLRSSATGAPVHDVYKPAED